MHYSNLFQYFYRRAIVPTLVKNSKFFVYLLHIHYRYRDRYWRQSLFTGIEKVKKSLESVYGAGKVSLANAAVRWMVHHSQLDPKYGGELMSNVLYSIYLGKSSMLPSIVLRNLQLKVKTNLTSSQVTQNSRQYPRLP